MHGVSLYKRALENVEKALGPDHPHVAASLNNLAELYSNQGRYGDAEPLYQRSLAILVKAFGPDHPHVAATMKNHAALLRETGRNTAATKLEARAKAMRARHPEWTAR